MNHSVQQEIQERQGNRQLAEDAKRFEKENKRLKAECERLTRNNERLLEASTLLSRCSMRNDVSGSAMVEKACRLIRQTQIDAPNEDE